MKVKPFKSVGAKLFYYMTALVLITVAGNSFQHTRMFMDHQTQQVQDLLQRSAEHASNEFENTIETWRSQLTVALPTLRTQGEGGVAAMQRFVDASPDFLGLSLFSASTATSPWLTPISSAFSSNVDDPRFEDKQPAKISQAINDIGRKWLKREIPRFKKRNVAVESISKSTGLPIMLIAVRFDVAKTQQVVWAILAAWQTKLIKPLPKSEYINSVVVDRKGKVVTSPIIADMIGRKKFSGAKLAKNAVSSSAPTGFEPEYKADGRRWLGAYARLAKFDLAVLVQKDAEEAYMALHRNLFTTGLWSILFILVAVMFAFLGAAGITRGLRAVTSATSRIASGDLNSQLIPESEDEVGLLAVAVNNMASRIVGLMQTQVDKAKIEKELETAKVVQSTFFPKADARIGALTVTGFYQPATQCGGDLWGHCPLAPGVDLVFVADAMGHGAPAALVTAMAYSTTMTIADIVKEEPNVAAKPSVMLDRLNRIIFDAVGGKISMTFFIAVIDSNRGSMVFGNAGHNFPIILPAKAGDPRSGKVSKAMAQRSNIAPISLKLMGTPLGMDRGASFKEQEIAIVPGDKMFLFTDGLIECTSPQKGVWGRKHLVDQLLDVAALPADKLKTEILNRAFAFYGTQPLDDDVTVVVVEVDSTWQPHAAAAPKTVTAKPSPRAGRQSPAVAPAIPVVQASPRPTTPRRELEPELVNAPAKVAAALPPSQQEQPVVLDLGGPPVPTSEAPQKTVEPEAAPKQVGARGKYKIKLPSTG